MFLPVVAVIALAWFSWDMSAILKMSQRKQQLAIEGRWNDLERHYESTLKTRRPFVWLQQRYLLPGAVLAQYALFLYKRGRLEEALLKADRSIEQIEGKPKFFRG